MICKLLCLFFSIILWLRCSNNNHIQTLNSFLPDDLVCLKINQAKANLRHFIQIFIKPIFQDFNEHFEHINCLFRLFSIISHYILFLYLWYFYNPKSCWVFLLLLYNCFHKQDQRRNQIIQVRKYVFSHNDNQSLPCCKDIDLLWIIVFEFLFL